MTNEQTIDAIMDAVLASQDSAFRRGDGLEGYEESVAADQCVRDMVTAALVAKDAEIAALKADAERYRWLRGRPEVVPTVGPDLAMWADCCGDAIRGDEADKAIDAAMSGA